MRPVLFISALIWSRIRGIEVTDRCIQESPEFFFTFPWSRSNSSCYGLCYSSYNAKQFDNRTAAFSCEAVITAGHQEIICSKCPINCQDACSAITAAPSALPTPIPTSLPT